MVDRSASRRARARRRLPWLLLLLAASCGGGGQGDEPASGAGDEQSEAGAGGAGDGFDALAALGYADYAPAGGEEGARTVLLDEEAACPGYTLYVSIPHALAELVDMHGAAVHAWRADGAVEWLRVRLLANGDLLVVGRSTEGRPGTGRFLERRAWSGEPRWRRDLQVHHDAVELADGRLLALTVELRVVPAVDAKRTCRDELVVELSADGEVERRTSLLDAYLATPGLPALLPAPQVDSAGRAPLDVLHANSAQLVETCARTGAGPVYAPGGALVALRHQDAVGVVDLDAGRFVWLWGRGQLVLPHEATLLPSGDVLVLDNGDERRGYSRVVEVDPTTGEIVWQYRAARPADFFTSTRGTAQGLSNGDVLVASTNQGEAFEVARDGRVVWRFLNPYTDDRGRRGALRAERLPPERVEPLLER